MLRLFLLKIVWVNISFTNNSQLNTETNLILFQSDQLRLVKVYAF